MFFYTGIVFLMWKIVYYLTPSSFCFGVERAINQLSDIIDSHVWDNIFCVHALVHNPKITKEFEDKWVSFVESIDDISDNNAVVVFSAHGINRVVLEQAKLRFKTVYNLECPFVSKIYNEINLFMQQWISTFFYIWKEYHQEKKNVVAYIKSKWWVVYAFPDKQSIPNIDTTTPFAVLSQTTMNAIQVLEIFDIIKTMYPNAKFPLWSDVCNATYERQAIVSDNIDKFDAFVVVWGQESSNARELYDMWVKYKKRTFYGESLDDILKYPRDELFACDTVAITWWASTPAEDIRAVFDFYRDNGYEPRMLSLN